MHIHSNSFLPYHFMPSKLAFGKHDQTAHIALSENLNPHLSWSGAPEGTESYALICNDPDVPSVATNVNQEGMRVDLNLPRVDFTHWAICDLPKDLSEIAEGAHSSGILPKGKAAGPTPDGGLHGLNDYTHWFAGDAEMGGDYCGYDGPCPPWNDERIHGYQFTVYALDVPTLGLSGCFSAKDLLAAMKGHILDQATIVGLYTINPNARPV